MLQAIGDDPAVATARAMQVSTSDVTSVPLSSVGFGLEKEPSVSDGREDVTVASSEWLAVKGSKMVVRRGATPAAAPRSSPLGNRISAWRLSSVVGAPEICIVARVG
ncbi:hypothetical protein HJFPF1_12679 [Paramyrothecium foliicola]|nr:hypothetical protein HJFPF1_12679 [Paramyrothecium foliicola]